MYVGRLHGPNRFSQYCKKRANIIRKIIKPNSLPRLLLWARAIMTVTCLATSFIRIATIYCHQKMHIHTKSVNEEIPKHVISINQLMQRNRWFTLYIRFFSTIPSSRRDVS